MNWILPPSPDSYSPIIDKLHSLSVSEGAALFIEGCEQDFFFFMRYCTRIGRTFICKEKGCDAHGDHMFDHPWIFERCREVQKHPDGYLDLWGRFHLKTSIITVGYTLWELVKDPNLCIAIGTYKLDETGEGFLLAIKAECEENSLLKQHWPHIFWENTSDAPVWKNNAITLKRTTSAREPSVMAFGIFGMQTSKHFDRIVWDDLVVEDAVSTGEQIRRTTERYRKTTGMAGQDCKERGVGCHWSVGDTYTFIIREQILELRKHDCYDENGRSVLHPGSDWLDKHLRKMGTYNFNAQMRNVPVEESSRLFQSSWLRHYVRDPVDEAKGKNIYYLVDPSSGKKRKSLGTTTGLGDYTAMIGMGLGEDGKRYVVDMVRDRINATKTLEIMMDIDKRWRGLGIPVITWYYEAFGLNRDVEFFSREMDKIGYRFDIKEVSEHVSKETRIERLQPLFEAGEILLPEKIFQTTDQGLRDIVHAFVYEEYTDWTANGGSRHDDMLDAMSFMCIPKVADDMLFPASSSLNLYAPQKTFAGPQINNPWAN